jgi:hypothetical protein
MRTPARRLTSAAAAVVALGGALAGCASSPRALGLHDTGVTQSLPVSQYHRVWFGVPLNNSSDRRVTIRSLELTRAQNLRTGTPFVIDIADGDSIDWYSPPGTKAMQAEVARRVPLVGFRVPAHSKDRYEAVVLVTARSTGAAASTTGAVVGYESGGHYWEETWKERSSLRLAR